MRLVNPYPHPLVYPTIACPAPTKRRLLYQAISCGRSPFRKLKLLLRYAASIGSFLMVDNKALSMDFWSAARLVDGFFFYSIISSCSFFPRSKCWNCHTSAFSPCAKKASSELFFSPLAAAKYFASEASSIFFVSIPARSTFWEVAIT